MSVLGLMLFLFLVIAIETPRLWRGKMWRELLVFGGLMAVSAAMALAAAMHVVLPNPTHMLDAVFKPPSEMIIHLLE